jgi:ubiquinone/menaquinone biosynthesis C-methylase UbiE
LSFDPRKQEQLVEPYSKLAYIYDDVMYHVDYKAWSRYIHRIIQKWHPHAQKILDISCGTGSLLLKLNLKNYKLYGCDFSFDMVKIAKRKIKAKKAAIPLWQGDMIYFGIKPKKVDVIVSLYDSVNYIMNKSGWQKMFDCVYHGLNNDGLFIFDICTEKNSRKYFHNYFEKKIGKGYYYTRESNYDSINKIHSNRFVIHFNSENATFLELHEQRILLLKEVTNLIKHTNFRLLGVYHGFTFKSATENSLRVHFVLKKKKEDDSII